MIKTIHLGFPTRINHGGADRLHNHGRTTHSRTRFQVFTFVERGLFSFAIKYDRTGRKWLEHDFRTIKFS